MTRFHTLRREQWIPRAVDEVFAFFSDAHNLEELTPPWLKFRILTPGEIQVGEGTELRYRLTLHGIPVYWKTEIRRWEPPVRFIDVQRRGPYRLWHHTHWFEPVNGGTRMTDVVRYRLPFGMLGLVANKLIVRRDVEKIFDYRYKQIHEVFGRAQSAE